MFKYFYDYKNIEKLENINNNLNYKLLLIYDSYIFVFNYFESSRIKKKFKKSEFVITRLYNTYPRHINFGIPEQNINIFHFALNPSTIQPTGHVDFRRVDINNINTYVN